VQGCAPQWLQTQQAAAAADARRVKENPSCHVEWFNSNPAGYSTRNWTLQKKHQALACYAGSFVTVILYLYTWTTVILYLYT
jgi:hypothetical protein